MTILTESQLPLTGLELKERGIASVSRPGKKTGYKPEPVDERFWRQVDVDGECWVWLGLKGDYGHGRFATGHVHGKRAKLVSAARWAYEYTFGPLPPDLEIDHLCRNPPCVNPEHLEPVTHAVNMRRGKNPAKTHCPRGHEYSQENTRSYEGRRFCRACERQRKTEYRCHPRPRRDRRTKCMRGHTFDKANTYITVEGRRSCLTCIHARNRKRRAVAARVRLA